MKTQPETLSKSIRWLGLGAVLTALAASVCCLGPFILISLGLSGAWIGSLTSLAPIRPLFIIASLLFIALGFRNLYMIPMHCEGEGHDPCKISYVQQHQSFLFWGGSIVIILFLAFPLYASLFFN